MTPRIALYPGSFDPFTLGHLDITLRAAEMFDALVIAVGKNIGKTPVFSLDERLALIDQTLSWHLRAAPSDALAAVIGRIRVVTYDDSLWEAARRFHARFVVRGLRANDDFNSEWSLAGNLAKLAPDIHLVHLMAKPERMFEKSGTVREIATFTASREQLEMYVAPPVAEAVLGKVPTLRERVGLPPLG